MALPGHEPPGVLADTSHEGRADAQSAENRKTNMGEQDDSGHPATDPAGRGGRGKLIFGLVLVAACVAVYFIQRKPPPELQEWANLDKALAQAKAENRLVVVLFVGDPLRDKTKRMLQTTLANTQNKAAIKKGRFIRAKLEVGSADSDAARKYGIEEFPTMAVLTPDGKERNRMEGFIGETGFREELLRVVGKSGLRTQPTGP